MSKSSPVAKPFYNPPTLLARQALSALYFATLTRWRYLPHWLFKAKRTLPTAAGATGMGCIGFPTHPVWEVTSGCNLRCCHCHVSAGKPSANELSTEEAKRLIADVASISEFRMLVFTGGEPMVRGDILELAECATAHGLTISIATNATLITPDIARRLKRAGVVDIAVGLDAANASIHDQIRGVAGCFDLAMRGIEASREAGLAIQINFTAMKSNIAEVSSIIDLAHRLDADIVLLYNLVPAGRSEWVDLELSPTEYAGLLELVAKRQRSCRSIIEPTCSPQYWPHLMGRNGKGPGWLAEQLFHGCVAGIGLCYIKPDGEVWPCPFIPVSGGNVRQIPLSQIWRQAEVFQELRDRKHTSKGKCRDCRYNHVCGGCRGRAYSHFGDYMADDPFCLLDQKTSVQL